jgi:hypothetical protein
VSDPADPTISAIDRLFDFIDKGVEATDRVLNRGKRVAEQQKARRDRREVIDAQSTPKATKKPASTTAVAKRPHFYIVEAIDAKSGTTIFVVTDGGNARTECSSRAFAEKILRALERSS